MGEIIFSLFIGSFLSGVGLLMNRVLYLEQKRHSSNNQQSIDSNNIEEISVTASQALPGAPVGSGL